MRVGDGGRARRPAGAIRSGPDEQAERVAVGVEADAYVVLGLEIGDGRAGCDGPGCALLEVVDLDVQMLLHLGMAVLAGQAGGS